MIPYAEQVRINIEELTAASAPQMAEEDVLPDEKDHTLPADRAQADGDQGVCTGITPALKPAHSQLSFATADTPREGDDSDPPSYEVLGVVNPSVRLSCLSLWRVLRSLEQNQVPPRIQGVFTMLE